MTELAKIMGTFADFKLVKTRQVAQFVVEVPLAEADKALDALGGLPRPESERWIALARINITSIKPQKERQAWDTLKLSAQASIRCAEPSFWTFLNEEYRYQVENKEDAAEAVREICGVDSRRQFNDNQPAAQRWHDKHGVCQTIRSLAISAGPATVTAFFPTRW